MHFTFFSVKRIHVQAQWKVLMPMMKRLALTPARFDVLLILSRDQDHWFMYQSVLRQWLGVSRTAVSKMTRTLEKLGFIRRERSQTANRQPVLLYITKLGRCVIRHALKVLKPRRRGPTQRAAHTIFVERWWASRREVLQDLRKTDAYLRRLRDVLADTALLVHPWDPDEREDIGLRSRPVFKPERFLPSTPAQIEAARWRPHSRIAGIPPRKPKPPRQPSMSSFL